MLIFQLFEEKKDKLYGFIVTVFVRNENANANLEDVFKSIMLSVEEENALWVNQQAHLFLNYQFLFERKTNLWRVVDYKQPPQHKKRKELQPCIRPETVDLILDDIFSRTSG